MAIVQSASPGASSLPRVPALDGLRGSAILTVILFHCLLATPTSGARRVDPLFETGIRAFAPMAMELFFVISGYLITSILDRTRDADQPLRTFYFRRALRIVPLYYGFLLLVRLLLSSLPEQIIGAPGSMVWEFGFLTNFAVSLHGREGVGAFFPHFWTLAIEEQFYVLWPLLILLQPKRRNTATCLTVLALSALTRTVLAFGVGMHFFSLPFASTDTTVSIFVLTPTHLDGLAAGAAAAFLQHREPDLTRKWSTYIMIVAAILMLAIFGSYGALYGTAHSALGSALWLAATPFCSAVLFAAVVAKLAMNAPETNPRWMTSHLLTSVARYSYGMYAFHVPLISLLFYANFVRLKAPLDGYDLPYRLFFYVLVAGFSYGAGFLSWNYYEKQFLKLAPKYRYSRRLGRPADLPLGGVLAAHELRPES